MSENTSDGVPTPKVESESIVAHFSDGLLMHFTKGETVINLF